jgi:hypothetical protein
LISGELEKNVAKRLDISTTCFVQVTYWLPILSDSYFFFVITVFSSNHLYTGFFSLAFLFAEFLIAMGMDSSAKTNSNVV